MNGSVLIVDDSLTVRMDIAEAFEGAGFRVLPCESAAAARVAFAAHAIDVLVLDVLLPDGDGIELLRELRAQPAGANAVVLMLSTEAEVKDRIRGLKTGADEYVGKPYDASHVVSRARELLRLRRSDVESKATVLVVDDSATVREHLRGALELEGYGVLTAASGEECLRIAADQRPSAIIVDGVMPGIDGPTVIRRLRLDAALRGTPCLLLTAKGDRDAELRALDAGADAFVRKEESLDVIRARLAAILRHGDSAPAGDATSSLLGPKRILAVDDSMTYLQELANALRGDGFDVVLARSGAEALELLAVQPVDCILLDLMMPGLSGQETCRRIKAAPVVRDIPLVMLTALEDRNAMIEGLSAGADDYISKSSEFDVLRARVRAQLRRKQFEDEHRRIRDELHEKAIEAAEARAAQEHAETRAALTEDLKRANAELEAFSYSVSHDLRAPLRSICGFSQVLVEDHAARLDDDGLDCLRRIQAATKRMGELIDDLLRLSRVSRSQITRQRVDLTALAATILAELKSKDPSRQVDVVIAQELVADADPMLVRIALENLLGNAWKFTNKRPRARIEFGSTVEGGLPSWFVRDNGAGFDAAHANRLFRPFQRLHNEADFPGTGIGLATVQRIVDRHGGRIRADGGRDAGATIYFSFGAAKPQAVEAAPLLA